MNWKYIGYFILAFIVIHIPFIGPFFRIANTLIHESAHAIVSLILQGQVLQIRLFANTEGVTYTMSSSYLASMVTSAAGYVGSSLAAYGLALLCSRNKHIVTLWLFVILASVNVLLWVRNPFGVIWLVLFIGLLAFALWRKGNWAAALSIGLFAFVLAESVSSSFTILWLSLYTPGGAGDAVGLANKTGLPAGFWGVFFMLQASLLGYLSVRTVLRTKRGGQGRGRGSSVVTPPL
ncbi:M50 family metallopeptidase [Paenibacillus sp. OV219]|uniref:M50 family metallopeptidase n=1 Tax=Paenibacillus sp. OV219 TaxID=1884377 RepID=UPI0008B8B196|nr:M50 family metallopeptidase [Paenibacillus sp. OV219]SEO83089.1 Peptidase M50B-like [Paenibacillus sp. OV219]